MTGKLRPHHVHFHADSRDHLDRIIGRTSANLNQTPTQKSQRPQPGQTPFASLFPFLPAASAPPVYDIYGLCSNTGPVNNHLRLRFPPRRYYSHLIFSLHMLAAISPSPLPPRCGAPPIDLRRRMSFIMKHPVMTSD